MYNPILTTLFAALDILEGKVIGQCMKRHRHEESIRFLNVIDASAPAKLSIHAIVDNYARAQASQGAWNGSRGPAFCLSLQPDFGLLAQRGRDCQTRARSIH